MSWYRTAAEQGLPAAQVSLADLYRKRGTQDAVNEAVRWYRIAAAQNYPPAQKALAGMYLRGEGVPKDRDEAERLLRRAANGGAAVTNAPPAPVSR